MGKKSLSIKDAFILGVQHQQKGNLKAAKKIYQNILKIDPNQATVASNLGLVFDELGEHQKAKECYEKSIEIQPNHASAHYNLGITLKKLGEYQKAKSCYEKAIQINPNYVDAHNNLGTIFQEMREHQKAKSCYTKAIQINPNHAIAHNNLGILFQNMGEHQKARSCYEKAIEINPNYADAHNNLGVVLNESGELQKAIDCYEKAIEINPNYADAPSNLGVTFQKLGKHIEAVDSYQEALIKRSGINFEGEKKLRPGTKSFFLELTNKCNFHCEFCPSDSQTRLHGFMDLSLVKKIFDEIALKKLVMEVQLHLMGEPTLHPKLNDILIYAKKKNVRVALTTNGSTLVEKTVPKLLQSIYGQIVASLMTPTKETYKIRGDVGLSWDRYINNFRLLIQEHLKRISRGEKIEYNIVIRIMVSDKSRKGTVKVLQSSKDIQENWNEWSGFVEDTEKQLGLKSFKRPKIDSNATLSLLNDYSEMSYDLQKGLTLQFWRAFTFANSRVSGDHELKYQEKTQYCPHPFTDFGVLWNGDVSLCCLDHDATLKVGDVRNHSIETVLKSTAAKKLRGSMYSLEELHPTCQKCQARPVEKVLQK